jgi:hypothetical protein
VAQEDWQLLARVARDTVPPWIARAIEHLNAAPDHHASHLVLARHANRLGRQRGGHLRQRGSGRLRKAGLITWMPSPKAWALVLEHARGVAEVIAGLAFEASSAAGFGSAFGRISGVSGDASRTL